jgi:hypothetical protein
MQLGKAVAAGVAAEEVVAAEKVEAVRPAEVLVEAGDSAVPEAVGSATAR